MDFEKDFRIFFPENKVFVSRDHNWAFSAWEIGRLRQYIKPGAVLVHIDNHLDDLCPEKEIDNILNENDALTIGKTLKIDEFITPALKNGTLEKVLMISDYEISAREDIAVSRAYTLNHYDHIYKKDWNNMTQDKSIILDLDLDFFNHNYLDYCENGIISTDKIIRCQLDYIKNMMNWDMVTVALSPEHCGGNEMCEHLFELFLEVFDLDTSKAKFW